MATVNPRTKPIDALSPRQREVLSLVAKGLTNDDIARVLGITFATARTHVAAILAALEAANRTEATALYLAWAGRPEPLCDVLARPAIAVLALTPLDDDARTRITALGLGNDLAALFARWCWFPVIARSSAAPPDRAALGATPADVGRALAARFLVDGTLRQERHGWRLDVYIDDAERGVRLWTERYELAAGQLFDVQEATCAAIVATAYPLLVARMASDGFGAPRADLGAWARAHEGMLLHARRELASVRDAERSFAAALEREPTLVLAHFGRGLCAYDDVLNQWGDAAAARDRLAEAGERCVALAPHAAEGHFLLGRHAQTHGDHAGAVTCLETAVAKNPSFALAHALLAQVLQLSGRSDEALTAMHRALRLGSRSFVAGLATLRFARAEYGPALEAAERAIATTPRYTYARALAVAAAWWLGDRARVALHLQALHAGYPAFRPAGFLNSFGAAVEVVERFVHAFTALGYDSR